MLAEIFVVRAETLARASQETIPVSRSPFIPFDRSVQLKFKDSNTSNSCCEIVDGPACSIHLLKSPVMAAHHLRTGHLHPLKQHRGSNPPHGKR
jgi:hypothetical protein